MHVLLHFVDCPQLTRILTIHMSHAVLWYMFTPQVPSLLTQHSAGKRLSSAMSLCFSHQGKLTTCIRQCGSRSATTFACMGQGSSLVFLHRMRDGHAHLHRGCLCACWPGPHEEEVGLDPSLPGSTLSCKARRFHHFCLGIKPSLVKQRLIHGAQSINQ